MIIARKICTTLIKFIKMTDFACFQVITKKEGPLTNLFIHVGNIAGIFDNAIYYMLDQTIFETDQIFFVE